MIGSFFTWSDVSTNHTEHYVCKLPENQLLAAITKTRDIGIYTTYVWHYSYAEGWQSLIENYTDGIENTLEHHKAYCEEFLQSYLASLPPERSPEQQNADMFAAIERFLRVGL